MWAARGRDLAPGSLRSGDTAWETAATVATPPSAGVLAELRSRCWVGHERASRASACWSSPPPRLRLLAHARCSSVDKWLNDPQYSHGLLVPLFAVGLLWLRRDRFPAKAPPAPLAGLALLTARRRRPRRSAASSTSSGSKRSALLPCLAGLVLTFGGWRVLRWALPADRCF